MGFFDPPYEKIIGWSSPPFQAVARSILPVIDGTAAQLGVPPSGYKLFRTAVLGHLALRASAEQPSAWTVRETQLIRNYTANAEALIPAKFRYLVPEITGLMAKAMERASVLQRPG